MGWRTFKGHRHHQSTHLLSEYCIFNHPVTVRKSHLEPRRQPKVPRVRATSLRRHTHRFAGVRSNNNTYGRFAAVKLKLRASQSGRPPRQVAANARGRWRSPVAESLTRLCGYRRQRTTSSEVERTTTGGSCQGQVPVSADIRWPNPKVRTQSGPDLRPAFLNVRSWPPDAPVLRQPLTPHQRVSQFLVRSVRALRCVPRAAHAPLRARHHQRAG